MTVIIVQKFQYDFKRLFRPHSHEFSFQRQTIRYIRMLSSAVMLNKKVYQ